MVKKLKVKKIKSVFYLNDRNYILFTTNYSKHDYIYYKHIEKDIKALLFGENLQEVLAEVLKNQPTVYIELFLDDFITGGISYNEGDLVESDFTKTQANQIISHLKNKKWLYSVIIELF